MKLKEEIESLDNFTEMIENQIIKSRVKHLLEWYVKKATSYKCCYYILSIAMIIINASIPVIHQFKWEQSKIFVSSISAIASIIASILTLVSVKDTWFRYRKHVELIKTECMLFNCQCGDYSKEDREKIFIENIENIISEERGYWEKFKFKNENEGAS
ncbi:MAG: DUF4231 domain-containing protein [Marinisporobacter sp.]|jgi:hypothetical protein|nr:DUF4231 domain-containing protein [Marinisporobacter sp.]